MPQCLNLRLCSKQLSRRFLLASFFRFQFRTSLYVHVYMPYGCFRSFVSTSDFTITGRWLLVDVSVEKLVSNAHSRVEYSLKSLHCVKRYRVKQNRLLTDRQRPDEQPWCSLPTDVGGGI